MVLIVRWKVRDLRRAPTTKISAKNRAKNHALVLHSEHELLLAVKLAAFFDLGPVIAHSSGDFHHCGPKLVKLGVDRSDFVLEIV